MTVVLPLIRAAIVAIVAFIALDLVVDVAMPHFERLRFTFSAAYLSREFASLAGRPVTLVLGDSVLWGYDLDSSKAAVSIVRRRHPDWHNLAFPGGSPTNTLAMLETALAYGVRPKLLIFNVNQKVFTPSDSSHARLYPAVEELAWPILSAEERSLAVASVSEAPDARLNRQIGRVWHFYGMRSDLRDALFRERDAAQGLDDALESVTGVAGRRRVADRPTVDKFEAAYDLDPLDDQNSAFHALSLLARLIEREHLRAIAILTPTNHALLHSLIDDAGYRANLASTRRLLTSHHITVLDLDDRFAGDEFIDNDHLDERGNVRLARLLDSAASR